MRWLRFLFQPRLAFRDLGAFLARRRRHEAVFAAAALALTAIILWGFVWETQVPRTYRREITYFQQWPASRSDAEVAAQQRRDAPIEAARRAELARREQERRDANRRLLNRMDAIGLR